MDPGCKSKKLRCQLIYKIMRKYFMVLTCNPVFMQGRTDKLHTILKLTENYHKQNGKLFCNIHANYM